MLRDYDTEITLGYLTYYTLQKFRNHSRVQYKRKHKATLKCSNKLIAHALGWIWVKTGFYIYG